MPERVPVVHVITQLELGGAQQNTLHTVRSLDRARFAPVLVTGPGGLLDDEARALSDVELRFVDALVRPIAPLKDLRAVKEIAEILRPLAQRGPVIVHTHSSKAGIVGRHAAKRAGARPVVHTIHGFGHAAVGNALARRAALAAERACAKLTDAFLSVAEAHVAQGKALGLFGSAPVHVVRSGIDVAQFARADELRAAARRELGIPGDAPVAGMIACLKPQKAPEDFVAVATRVARELPEARFFLAGDGELRGAVETAIAREGLSSRLRLLGWRRDVPALLGALDVFVLTSRWEGLPRVCPQAMAAGRPIVAPSIDGIPEAIKEGVNGFLFPPGDIDVAAQRVVQLLRDSDLRLRFGQASRQIVSIFDQALMVRRQEEIYAELLAGQNPNRLAAS